MKLLKVNVHKCLVQTLGAIILATVALVAMSVPQAQASGGFPMYSWGDTNQGRLGRPVTAENPHDRPARVGVRTDWRYSTTAYGGSFAISTQGHIYGWGAPRNSARMAQGGGSDTSPVTVPTRIGTLNHWEQIVARNYQVVALSSAGFIYIWGDNFIGPNPVISTPTRLGDRNDWVSVELGGQSVFAIDDQGRLYAWGSNTVGQLGLGPTTPFFVGELTRVGERTDWAQVRAMGTFVVAITTGGQMWSWGMDGQLDWAGQPTADSGRLGREFTPCSVMQPYMVLVSNTPGRIGTASDWVDVELTMDAAVALNAEGELWSWGHDNLGQLGRNLATTGQRDRPGRIGSADNWVTVMGGNRHFLAINDDRELFSWGSNQHGQLGTELPFVWIDHWMIPIYVATLERFSAAARGGGMHSLMLIQIDPAEKALSLTKHLQKPEGTPNPNRPFTFNVDRHSFDHDESLHTNLPVIGSIVLPAAAIANPDTAAGITTRIGSIDIFEGVEFTQRGRFTYRVSEQLGSSGLNPSGNYTSPINYSRALYEVSVYVDADPEDAERLIVIGVTILKIRDCRGNYESPSVKVYEDEFIFTNIYRRTVTDALAVSKTITGTYANLNDTFSFTITLSPTALCPDPTTFTGRRVNAAGTLVNPQPVFTRNATTGITTVTVTLGHNERFLLDDNVAVGTGFEVVEAPSLHHIASVTVTAGTAAGGTETVERSNYPNPGVNAELSTLARLIGVGTGANANSAAFTNAHHAPPITGLLIGNNFVYVFLVAAALMAGTLVAVKSRKRIEDMPMGNLQPSMQVSGIANNIGEGEN